MQKVKMAELFFFSDVVASITPMQIAGTLVLHLHCCWRPVLPCNCASANDQQRYLSFAIVLRFPRSTDNKILILPRRRGIRVGRAARVAGQVPGVRSRARNPPVARVVMLAKLLASRISCHSHVPASTTSRWITQVEK